MELTCTVCNEGTGSDGNPCKVCNGDGVIDLIDAEFGNRKLPPKVFGIIWNDVLTRLSDVEDKVDDVMNKCNDIKEVVDAL